VGLGLGLDERELATLDLAACLSQVGKIFVPQAILVKAGQLDDAERRIMRRHVEHAVEVIGPIDFDLPIGDVIGQMHEHLDGSGYPKGLRGEQIRPLARILGVVDVFCALTETRAYRDQLSAGKALMYLAENPHLYDARVVAALAEAVAAEGVPGEGPMAAVSDGARLPVAAA
jgi:HD-GYP domain-containing protein (c-di-GMP phosphodiesterase class II)